MLTFRFSYGASLAVDVDGWVLPLVHSESITCFSLITGESTFDQAVPNVLINYDITSSNYKTLLPLVLYLYKCKYTVLYRVLCNHNFVTTVHLYVAKYSKSNASNP